MNIIEIKIGDKSYFMDFYEWEKMNDWDKWGRYDEYKFWEKYPESKPIFEPTKVILNEADKMPFASEEHRQAYINSLNNK